MLPDRLTFNISWFVNLNQLSGPFRTTEEFIAHANDCLVSPFPSRNPQLEVTTVQKLPHNSETIDMTWSLDADPKGGAAAGPKFLKAHVQMQLLRGISFFVSRLGVEERKPA